MSTPIVIHVLRPYASEEEYLARERFSIEAKSMLLIDQPPLPVDTPVVFDVALANGQKPIRAEGKVIAHVPAQGDLPGGLRVRFRRFGAATKAFIDRAVAGSSAPASQPQQEAPSQPQQEAPSLSLQSPAESADPSPTREAHKSSGVHRKTVSPVAAPANRDALLNRLRARRAG